jgi:uncharacterized protein
MKFSQRCVMAMLLGQRFSGPDMIGRPDHHTSQEKVFSFLSDPETHQGHAVQRIDTHAAAIFLAGPRVFKVKRNVKFPFLDYSTLAKRKQACEQEIEINRLFAPKIYDGVIAITQKPDGGLELGGSGRPVEWAVAMSRFNETSTLDRLARAGSIDRALAEQIADAIIVTHDKATVAHHAPWIDSIPALIAANSAAFAGHFDREIIEDLEREGLSTFRRIHGLLRKRERKGFMRRCHGDLHLANIALIDGKPALFDAIQFDPAIATTDVLYDLAFTLMDLLYFDQNAASNSVFNRYLQRAPLDHLDGLSVLPLFMSLRAAIRAKVILAREGNESARAANRQSALTYFSLARRLIKPAAPKLIAIGGLSGTGKSTVARKLAPAITPLPGAVVLRSDVLRKQHFQSGEFDKLPADAYTPEITKLVYEQLMSRAERILAQGHSAILDAVFARPSERAQPSIIAAKQHATLCAFFLTADIATRLNRIAGRNKDVSDATLRVALQQEHYETGQIDWDVVDATRSPAETMAQMLLMYAARQVAESARQQNKS